LPPELSLSQLTSLVDEVRSHQLTHGSLIKLNPASTLSPPTTSLPVSTARPVGASLFPSAFPRTSFEHAQKLQHVFNELYAAVACDEVWLEEVLRPLIETDELAGLLWRVYSEVRQSGAVGAMGRLEMGIWRADYMLHHTVRGGDSNGSGCGLIGQDAANVKGEQIELKQVEFNTISCAGGVQGNIIADMHRQFLTGGGDGFDGKGIYDDIMPSTQPKAYDTNNMPSNTTTTGIASGLRTAFDAYATMMSMYADTIPTQYPRCILMIVLPDAPNICDERPISDVLRFSNPFIPMFRLELTEILQRTVLQPSGVLLFEPNMSHAKTTKSPRMHPRQYEVAVIYIRAGHALLPSSHDGGASFVARVRMEKSLAIKCPSVLAQMCTFKAVQAALTEPKTLARFLQGDEEKLAAVLEASMDLMSLDDVRGQQMARRIVEGVERPDGWVLKPSSAEGGGNCLFGGDVVPALGALLAQLEAFEFSMTSRSGESADPRAVRRLPAPHVLMRRITSPPGIKNYLSLGTGQVYAGDVVSELGIFGACLFQRPSRPGQAPKIHNNEVVGWSLKSKKPDVNEMSVVLGYGAFDSLRLVDDESFVNMIRENEEQRELTGDFDA